MTRKPDPPLFLPPVGPELLERLADRFPPEHRRDNRPNPQNAHPRDTQEGTPQ